MKKKLWCCGVPVDVHFVEGSVFNGDGECHGDCDKSALVIRVEAVDNKALQLRTLLHEITHAMAWLVMGNMAPKVPEEILCHINEVGLTSVLLDRRNRWLLEMVEEAK